MTVRPAAGFFKCALCITSICIIFKNKSFAGLRTDRLRWM